MTDPARSVPVEVTLRGNVGESAANYARTKVESALSVAHGPVLRAHVVLAWLPGGSLEEPATAEASADVDGSVVRAKVAAPTMAEAVDTLKDRLRRQVLHMQDRTRTRHRWTAVAAEGEWRHGDLPRRERPYFPRPVELRDVVRRKSFASEPMTVDEAAYEMDLLDHDFFLYRDAATGGPALVHRLAEGGFGVRGAEPDHTLAAVTPEPGPPKLSDAAARTRLDAGEEPFVFYRDRAGEGCVLYRRYDGHYGLIELAN